MGTHPIFESDFDCLTEKSNSKMRPLFFLPLIFAGSSKPKKDQFIPKCTKGQFRVSFLEDSKLAELAAAEYGSRLDHDWGACVMQGHRGHMEDRIITKSYFNNVYSIYIVFDGHGGDTVVKYAEKEFVKFILDEGEKLFKSFEENPEKYCPNKIKGLLERAFPAYDRTLMHKEPIHMALLDPKTRSTSGCTCTGVIITHQHVIAFNTGDSRTLLIDAQNTPNREDREKAAFVKFATKDHKPDDPEETRRIEKSGGFVSLPPQTYIPRVNGQLALSRAFGDFQLKMSKKVEQNEQAVITDPDVDIFDRNDISHIVVGSDGVYDGLENNDVMKHALKTNHEHEENARFMLLDSLANRSGDNMAAIIIDLFGQNYSFDSDSGIESDHDEL